MSSDDAKASKGKVDTTKATVQPVLTQDFSAQLNSMFNDFYERTKVDKEENRLQFAELRTAISALSNPVMSNPSPIDSPNLSDHSKASIPDRSKTTRRSTIFFGGSTPMYNKPISDIMPQIQILQNDVVYQNELKVSSLAGLQHLSKQMQILASMYPGRDIKMSHMVSYNLRPHVVANWNSFCFKHTQLTEGEYEELMVEDWLSFSNETVQDILIEAARPRTRELYTKELILYLGKDIPQSPDINIDNFSKIFYSPLTRSLNDLFQIFTLLSEETSNLSNNAAKMPIETYGTKDCPGHISLWIISLGNQKEAMLQFLGKDELLKQKTLKSAFRFIRFKLMEARTQCEARQDFDSKLTPLRWNELRHTQGESHSRQQVPSATTQNKHPYDSTKTRFPSRATFSALSAPDSLDNPQSVNTYDDDYADDQDEDTYQPNSTDDTKDLFLTVPSTLNFISPVGNKGAAIAATFRGYCSELFVLGKCTTSNCTNDHSTASQERCIQSFNHLARRDLLAHGNLPHWTPVQSSVSRSDIKLGYKTPPPHNNHTTGSQWTRGQATPGRSDK